MIRGTIAAVCTSPEKGTEKVNVHSAVLKADWGIEGDAHVGKWHRQVSLLSLQKVREFNLLGAAVSEGAFGENLLVDGIDCASLPVGTVLRCGDVTLQVTQIGKECHQACAIRQRVGTCIMPHQGIFARVLTGGVIREGDAITAETDTREAIVGGFYGHADEDSRLRRSRHGQLEYATTMAYIRRYAGPGARVLEVGAGTGRYSAALAREGMRVTAVELLEPHLAVLRENARGLENLEACQGDATDLSRFADDSFDVTLVFGPMYHLYEAEDVDRAVDEAIRVTKPGGVLLFAFLSVYAILYCNYFQGNWAAGRAENFTEDFRVRHFKEQLFTGYDVAEFERMFDARPVDPITTAGTDGLLEAIGERADFSLSDGEFEDFAAWHLHFAEKRELLGYSSHLLYICRKRERR